MFETILQENINITSMLICFVSSIVIGFIIAFTYTKTTKYNKNFIISLTLLPILVCVIIMLVNGNLGTSVAILGAFSLVRFRSLPGNSKEIISIFFSMTMGLIIGTGYIMFGFITTLLICILLYLLTKTSFGENKGEKILRITIPEDLDYQNIFDDIFKKYTKQNLLDKIKTTNMGSLYELTYRIILKESDEKALIDELRCRNGNLKILLSRNIEDSEL